MACHLFCSLGTISSMRSMRVEEDLIVQENVHQSKNPHRVDASELRLVEDELKILDHEMVAITKTVQEHSEEEARLAAETEQYERIDNRAKVLETINKLSELLTNFDKRVNQLYDACEAGGVDVGLMNLVSMLREACIISCSKATALHYSLLHPKKNRKASFVSLLHVERALTAAQGAYDELGEMLIVIDRVQKHKDKEAGMDRELTACEKMEGQVLMSAADAFLETAVWNALRPLWHTVALHLVRGITATHFGIRCTYCEAIPIKGVRYHSATKVGDCQIDLCQDCFQSRKYPIDTMFIKIDVPIPIGHYESSCGFCLKVPIIGGRFISRDNIDPRTGLNYELCNKCFTYNPEHFHDAEDQFDETCSEENALRSFSMAEHTRRDTEAAGEWFNCAACQKRRKYDLHGPVHWLLGVQSRVGAVLCATCAEYKSLQLAIDVFGEEEKSEGNVMPVANKALYLVTWTPITEAYFLANTTRFPLLYLREEEPLIPEMVYKATNKELLRRIRLLAHTKEDREYCRAILAEGSLSDKSLTNIVFQLGQQPFTRIYAEVYKKLHLDLEAQIASFYELNAEQEDALEQAQEAQ